MSRASWVLVGVLGLGGALLLHLTHEVHQLRAETAQLRASRPQQTARSSMELQRVPRDEIVAPRKTPTVDLDALTNAVRARLAGPETAADAVVHPGSASSSSASREADLLADDLIADFSHRRTSAAEWVSAGLSISALESSAARHRASAALLAAVNRGDIVPPEDPAYFEHFAAAASGVAAQADP